MRRKKEESGKEKNNRACFYRALSFISYNWPRVVTSPCPVEKSCCSDLDYKHSISFHEQSVVREFPETYPKHCKSLNLHKMRAHNSRILRG